MSFLPLKSLAFSFIFVTFAVSQDATESGVMPTRENRTSLVPGKGDKKLESWAWSQPDMAQASSSHVNTLHPVIHSNYYLPGVGHRHGELLPQRAEYFPYTYEGSGTGEHVAQGTEHSLGYISKHFVIVSFIGLLLLFAIIHNSMATAKRRDALIDVLSTRRKRDLIMIHGLHPMTSEEENILGDDSKIRCIQRTLCLENRKLLKDFGTTGKVLAKYLTRSVESSVERQSGWGRLVADAGVAGLRGENCDILYRDCDFSKSFDRNLKNDVP